MRLTDALERVRRALDTMAELNLFARYPSYAKRSDALAEAMINGDSEAFHRFVLFHRRLVDWVARRYARLLHLDLEDAQQIGVMGLLHAAKRFDPSRGLRFSTFGTHCIQGFCKRLGPPAGQLIRIPPHVYWPCIKVRQKLQAPAAEGPSADQHTLNRLQGEDTFLGNYWSDFQRLLNGNRCPTAGNRSISRPANWLIRAPRRSNTPLMPSRPSGLEPSFVGFHLVRRRSSDSVMGSKEPALTLAQIGERFQITRERVRQIQAAAEERLHRYILAEMPSLATEAAKSESEPTNDNADAGPKRHPIAV